MEFDLVPVIIGVYVIPGIDPLSNEAYSCSPRLPRMNVCT